MAQQAVDFYILNHGGQQHSWLLACQLLEKAYLADETCLVLMNNLDDAKRFDDFLWTFREDSFVPHQLGTSDCAVQIVTEITPSHSVDCIINLSLTLPNPAVPAKQRLVEIVFPDPNVQQLARDRFRHYREKMYNINTIKLDKL